MSNLGFLQHLVDVELSSVRCKFLLRYYRSLPFLLYLVGTNRYHILPIDIGIGSPFVTPRGYAKEGLPYRTNQFFINNRVFVFHFGYEGSIKELNFILKTSYSLNYGTYRTINSFPETKQLSTYFEANKELRNGLDLGIIFAFDTGDLFNDSFGLFLKASKSFQPRSF